MPDYWNKAYGLTSSNLTWLRNLQSIVIQRRCMACILEDLKRQLANKVDITIRIITLLYTFWIIEEWFGLACNRSRLEIDGMHWSQWLQIWWSLWKNRWLSNIEIRDLTRIRSNSIYSKHCWWVRWRDFCKKKCDVQFLCKTNNSF